MHATALSRRPRLTAPAFCLALLAALPAAGQGTKADYERAHALAERFSGKLARSRVEPVWVSETRFWYRVDLGGGRHEYVLIDAAAGERRPAFNHVRMAAALNALELADNEEAKPQAADQLAIDSLAFDSHGVVSHVRSRGAWRRWDDAAGALHGLAEGEAPPEPKERKPWAPPKRPRWGGDARRTSPDGQWKVVGADGGLTLRRLQPQPADAATWPAPAGDDYLSDRVYWAPDSSAFVAMHVSPSGGRKVHLIESSPKDQLQGKLHTLNYLKPGDKIERRWPRLFRLQEQPTAPGDRAAGGGEAGESSAAAAAEVPVDRALFDNPWSVRQLRWAADASRFTFVYNQRGHEALRLVSVDAATGAARALIDDRSDTFIDYAHKQFTHYLDGAGEVVWMSERDGWNHLYLIDAASGAVKRQLTRGPWVVRGVEHVDAAERTVLIRCGGIYADQDPYHVHYARVDLDTGELTRLTAGDGTHRLRYSPGGEFCLDTYSRVDLPPVTELRRVADGALVCVLERGDDRPLRAAGWRPPERFVAKGRDGKTDIYGVIHRPTNFDPAKKYPVVEEHYAGPQSAYCPKRFRAVHARPQQLAELGFIVVQMDGMGTSHRSKAFHDVASDNLVDGGLPDRIAWIKAAARHEGAMDLSRVGIRGTSAGGQTGMAALLWHGDFYKVGVANCGCHDNRVDKIWWNELWMGWPVGPHYAEQSNVTNAHRLRGDLLLIVGEMDRNVDPVSTLQVVDALVKADKDFDMLVVPGGGHGAGPYARRRTWDFLVEKLHGVQPRRE